MEFCSSLCEKLFDLGGRQRSGSLLPKCSESTFLCVVLPLHTPSMCGFSFQHCRFILDCRGKPSPWTTLFVSMCTIMALCTCSNLSCHRVSLPICALVCSSFLGSIGASCVSTCFFFLSESIESFSLVSALVEDAYWCLKDVVVRW